MLVQEAEQCSVVLNLKAGTDPDGNYCHKSYYGHGLPLPCHGNLVRETLGNNTFKEKKFMLTPTRINGSITQLNCLELYPF